MLSDREIDLELLANITKEWRKLAFVVGMTMLKLERSEYDGRNDMFFAERVAELVNAGFVEHTGDLKQMRECEVRLPPNVVQEVV